MNSLQNVAVEALALGTWFTTSLRDRWVTIETREHGDIGMETAGAVDVLEGRRIVSTLGEMFPMKKMTMDITDEWVVITVH